MTTPQPTMRAITRAVCERLAQAGVAYWPGEDGDYTRPPGGPPPVYAKRLQTTPETALAVAAYQIDPPITPGDNVTVARVQVRARAPYDADPLADAALTALHGAHHQKWGGLRVARCAHLSAVQLGADQAGLDERTDNYELHITNDT